MRRTALRYLILLFVLLVNLAIAERAQAGWKSSVCIDEETGQEFECCLFCLLNCGCDAPSP